MGQDSGQNRMYVSRREFLRLSGLMGAAGATMWLAGCRPSQPQEPKPSTPAQPGTPAPAPEPQFPRGTLTIVQGVDVETLDPQVSTSLQGKGILSCIYDLLVTWDAEMNLVPWLANSWEILDGTRWEFKLRDDVKFHNGEHMTAELVKANWKRYISPDLVGNTNAHMLQPVTDIEILDDYTFHIVTDGPYGILLEALATAFHMLPTDALGLPTGSGGIDPNVEAVGTGPYRLVEWVPGERVVLEATGDHFSLQPRAERIVWKPVPEASTRVVELKTGQADVITNVPGAQAAEVEGMIHSVPVLGSQHINLNCEHPALSDVRVRQALNYAVDVQGLIDVVLQGYAEPLRGPIGVAVAGYDPSLTAYGYDPDRARQLLTEANWGDGFELELVSPDGRYPGDRMMSEAIAGQWTAIGVNTSVKVMEWGTFIQGVLGRSFDAYFIRMGTAMTDQMLSINFHSTEYGGRGPWNGYVNPEVDELIEKARRVVDTEERNAVYRKVNGIVRDEAPWVFLYQYHDLYGVGPRVREFRARPDGMIPLGSMYVED